MSRASLKRRADPIWIRNSITARAPAAAIAPSSTRCFAPRLVTASGNSANPRWRFEQKIDARVFPVLHLAADRGIAGNLGDRAGGDRLGGERIGMDGVDTHELGAAVEIDLDQLPAVGELAAGVCRLRQPDARARHVEADHRSGISAVHRYRLARGSTTSA